MKCIRNKGMLATQAGRRNVIFFNPILFAICTSTSANCVKTCIHVYSGEMQNVSSMFLYLQTYSILSINQRPCKNRLVTAYVRT
jgi:hypothetical protein